MGMIQEFKPFAMRGNVVDMAVGIIIGGTFVKIVSSSVEDAITPPIGVLVGGVDFSNPAITVTQAVGDTPALTLGHGKFIQTVIDFVIIAFAIVLLIKLKNTLQKKQLQRLGTDKRGRAVHGNP